MPITEEEARKKWCPMATITAKDSDAVGNREYGKPVQFCIASDCMMWRAVKFAPKTQGRRKGSTEWVDFGWNPRNWPDDKLHKDHEFRDKVHPSTGFCGLAGDTQ